MTIPRGHACASAIGGGVIVNPCTGTGGSSDAVMSTGCREHARDGAQVSHTETPARNAAARRGRTHAPTTAARVSGVLAIPAQPEAHPGAFPSRAIVDECGGVSAPSARVWAAVSRARACSLRARSSMAWCRVGLIVLDDDAERAWAFQQNNSDQWVGITDIDSEGSWIPVTDQAVWFAGPAYGNLPAKDCLYLNSTTTIAEACSGGHPYLCECDGQAANSQNF